MSIDVIASEPDANICSCQLYEVETESSPKVGPPRERSRESSTSRRRQLGSRLRRLADRDSSPSDSQAEPPLPQRWQPEPVWPSFSPKASSARPSGTPIEQLLVADTYRGRYYLNARLVKAGLTENRSERCGIVQWRSALTFAVHHVNGLRNDNQLEDLSCSVRTVTARRTISRAATGLASGVPIVRRTTLGATMLPDGGGIWSV